MYDADIRGSIVHSKHLTLGGILTRGEETEVVNGLETAEKEGGRRGESRFDCGNVPRKLADLTKSNSSKFVIHPHHNEGRVTEFVGPISGKLHTRYHETTRSCRLGHVALVHEREMRGRNCIKISDPGYG